MKQKLGSALWLGLIWIVTVVGGMIWLTDLSARPGDPGRPSAEWPSRSTLRRGTYTVVVSAHPRCPCTHATLDELAIALSDMPADVVTHVLFTVPEQVDANWWRTNTLALAQSIPGVTATIDRGGVETALFGAITSGSIAVYDTAGRLRFAGGITGARGHAGDNAGRRALVSLLKNGVSPSEAPVFGCPLQRPTMKASVQ